MLKNKNFLANYCLRKIIIEPVYVASAAVPGGGAGGLDPPPPGISQTIGFLKYTALEPPRNSQSYPPGTQCWDIKGTQAKRMAKWRFAGGSMMANLSCILWGFSREYQRVPPSRSKLDPLSPCKMLMTTNIK